jgi:ubiquinone/menaquinone biosynthesis C-methylase UbiE
MTEWNQILREEAYSKEEPDEYVVSFANLLQKRKAKSVLDLGCGAGRHVVHMAKQGFETHGMDISETGLDQTKERLRRENLEAYLVKCDMRNLPYADSCFASVVCLHTVYHQKLRGIQEAMSEIHRLLNKEGFLLMNFLSKRTYSYGKGKKVEENTFMEQEGPEKGVLHHFTDEEEIAQLFKNFKVLDVKLAEREVDGKLRSSWIVTAMV